MKRKMPRKVATLDLSEDGYDGFEVDAWVNSTVGWSRHYLEVLAKATGRKATTADEKAASDLFLEIFPSWRGFVDWEGKKIPHTRAGTDEIPADLAKVMWRRRAEALQNGAMPGPLEPESSEPPSDEPKG